MSHDDMTATAAASVDDSTFCSCCFYVLWTALSMFSARSSSLIWALNASTSPLGLLDCPYFTPMLAHTWLWAFSLLILLSFDLGEALSIAVIKGVFACISVPFPLASKCCNCLTVLKIWQSSLASPPCWHGQGPFYLRYMSMKKKIQVFGSWRTWIVTTYNRQMTFAPYFNEY